MIGKYCRAAVIVLAAILLSGCGGQNASDTAGEPGGGNTGGVSVSSAASSGETDASAYSGAGEISAAFGTVPGAAGEGKVLNIFAPDEDFLERMKGYYPDYEEKSDRRGRIENVEVVWHIEEDADLYRDMLDDALRTQTGDAGDFDAPEGRTGSESEEEPFAAAEDSTAGETEEDSNTGETGEAAAAMESDQTVDIYVADEAYVRDYIDSEYALDVVKDLGLTEEELSDQFPYTRQIATDEDGAQRGVSWKATPGVFVYRRSIAEDVLGTDDSDKVQEAVSNWEKFEETASKAREDGYYMLSGYDDAYRVFSDNVSRAFVQDDVLKVDDHLLEWAELTRRFTELGYNHGTELWSDEWEADQTGDGRVFGFFYSNWSLNYMLVERAAGENTSGDPESAYGDYAVCRGPEPYHWGGSWIIGAAGTDNPTLVKDIMKTMTCDSTRLRQITTDLHEFTNTQSGMEEFSRENRPVSLLGGQNPYPVLVETAEEVDQSRTNTYDSDLDEGFQVSMRTYIDGEKSEEDALQSFYSVALKKYPELTVEEEADAENTGNDSTDE